MTLERGLPTTGRVLDAQGKALPGTHLIFEPEAGETLSTKTDDDGRFNVSLLARTYNVKIREPNEDPVTCGTLNGGAQDAALTAR